MQDDGHRLVCALTNIWLFMELSRGTGKLASRPVRLKGCWASFFLAEKKKNLWQFLAHPGLHKALGNLWPGLSKLMCTTGQGKRKS